MLGGPPAVAVPAAATVARHTLATTAATIGFKLIWTPFRSEVDETARHRVSIMTGRPRAVNNPDGQAVRASPVRPSRPRPGTLTRSGEVSERAKERDWKSRTGRKVRRGFKSRPLRFS